MEAFPFGQVVHHVSPELQAHLLDHPALQRKQRHLSSTQPTCAKRHLSRRKPEYEKRKGKSQGDKRGLHPVSLTFPSEGGWRGGGLLRDFSKRDRRGSNWTRQVNSPVASAWRVCASLLRTSPDRKIFFSSTFSTLVSTRTTEPSGMGLEGEGGACQGSGRWIVAAKPLSSHPSFLLLLNPPPCLLCLCQPKITEDIQTRSKAVLNLHRFT